MPHFLADGSVVSGNISLGLKKTFFQRKKEKRGVCKARVEKVLFADDPKNTSYGTSNPQVEYICTIIGGAEAGRKVFNVKSVAPLGAGSPFNSGEIVHTPNLDGDSDKEGKKAKTPEETTASIVLLDWVHGSEAAPMIVNSLKHPMSGASATKEDGYRSIFEYGGFQFGIDKEGALKATYGGGPKDKDGKPKDENAAGTSMTFSKEGSIGFDDGEGQSISIDKKNKKVNFASSQGMDVKSGGPYNINVDGDTILKSTGSMKVAGAVTAVGDDGGLMSARMNDPVIGFDGEGRPINAFVGLGSSNVLVGG